MSQRISAYFCVTVIVVLDTRGICTLAGGKIELRERQTLKGF